MLVALPEAVTQSSVDSTDPLSHNALCPGHTSSPGRPFSPWAHIPHTHSPASFLTPWDTDGKVLGHHSGLLAFHRTCQGAATRLPLHK